MPMIIRRRRCFYLFHMWSVRVCIWEVDKSCYALLIYTFSAILHTYKHVKVHQFWSKKYELFPRIVSVYNWHPTYVRTMSHTLYRSLLLFLPAAQPNDAIRIQCKLLLLIGLERVGCCVNRICIAWVRFNALHQPPMLPLSRKRSFCWTDNDASLGLSSEARAQKIYGKLDRRYSIEVYSLTSFLTGYTITSLHTLWSASKQHTYFRQTCEHYAESILEQG